MKIINAVAASGKVKNLIKTEIFWIFLKKQLNVAGL